MLRLWVVVQLMLPAVAAISTGGGSQSPRFFCYDGAARNEILLRRLAEATIGSESERRIERSSALVLQEYYLSAIFPFTGKERDAETGLDYFGARYMSAAQGRFTSADLPLVDQHAEDPQSWNLYGYVRNNPLRFIDPTGRDCVNSVSSGFENESLNGQACFTATSTADRAITNPFFFAVAQGANQAAPVVNALGVGLAFGAEMATGVPIGMLAQLGSSDTAPAAGQSVEAGTAGFLLRNPQDIRFTQNSISAEFRNGQNIGSTIDALRTGATSPSEIPAIRTFERKGLTYTLDNRRLFAASEAGTQVATRPASASEILRNAFKFTTTNEGRFIGIRGAVKVLTRGRF